MNEEPKLQQLEEAEQHLLEARKLIYDYWQNTLKKDIKKVKNNV